MATIEIDAKGLFCPEPLILLQKAQRTANPGDVLSITCTDPGVEHDIPAWCRIHNLTITKQHEADGVWMFDIVR